MNEPPDNLINLADMQDRVKDLLPIPKEVIDQCETLFPWLTDTPKKWHEEQKVNARDVLGRVFSHGDKDLQVICSIEVCPADNQTWLHVSVSREERIPNYDDMRKVKHTFCGETLHAYENYPPQETYVKMNRTNRHLFAPITKNPMPEFARELMGGEWEENTQP